nr:MAG TPA: hypothetical protein [Caudoviricetes sp.]
MSESTNSLPVTEASLSPFHRSMSSMIWLFWDFSTSDILRLKIRHSIADTIPTNNSTHVPMRTHSGVPSLTANNPKTAETTSPNAAPNTVSHHGGIRCSALTRRSIESISLNMISTVRSSRDVLCRAIPDSTSRRITGFFSAAMLAIRIGILDGDEIGDRHAHRVHEKRVSAVPAHDGNQRKRYEGLIAVSPANTPGLDFEFGLHSPVLASADGAFMVARPSGLQHREYAVGMISARFKQSRRMNVLLAVFGWHKPIIERLRCVASPSAPTEKETPRKIRKARYAKTQPSGLGFSTLLPLQSSVTVAILSSCTSDHEPVHVAVGDALRAVAQLAPVDPHVERAPAHGDSRVGERLGYLRRRTSLGIIPTQRLEPTQFDGLRSLFPPAHGTCDPLVCGSCGEHGLAQFARADLPVLLGRIQREVDFAGKVVDDVHVESRVRERGKACMAGACDERGLEVLHARILAPVQGVDAVEATPQFTRRRVEQIQQIEHVKSYRCRRHGRLDAHGRMPSRMQCRVEAVMQRRDITRQAQ